MRRTPVGRATKTKITPEMVRLFKLCVEIQDEGLHDIPEDEGGRKREFYDADLDLYLLLKLKPYDFDPVENAVTGDEPPAWVVRDGDSRIKEWKKGAALRRELEQAAVRVTLG